MFLQCLLWSQDTAGFTTQKYYQGEPWNHQTSRCATMNEINRTFKTQPGDSQAGDKFQGKAPNFRNCISSS